MSGKAFIDSNILIYAHDTHDPRKHVIAQALLADLLQSRTGLLSPQVLQEFYVNVTRKVAVPLPKGIAREIVEDFSILCVNTTAADVTAAFRIENESKISFWDALICASALKSGAQTIYSEDLNHGQEIAGICIENPFFAA